ncbi:MAG: oligosaccharide flippase family protein [Nanoarchaeota archaeon]|nr:oligosaccharide flippase family protein [Nanoarchaeota archaeon]
MSFDFLVKKVGKGASQLSLARFISYLSAFVISVFIARMLSPHEYGLFQIVFSLFLLFFTLSELGMGQALAYFVPKFNAIGEEKKSVYLVRYAVKWRILSSFIFGIVFFFLSGMFASVYKDASVKGYVQIFSLFMVFYSLSFLFNFVFQALQKFKEFLYREVIFSVSRLMVIVFLFAGFGLTYVFIGYGVCYVISAVFSIYLVLKLIKIREWEPTSVKGFWHYSLIMTVGVVAMFVANYIVTPVLGLFVPPEQVSFFSIAWTISFAAITPSAAIISAFLPVVSELSSKGREKELAKVFRWLSKFVIITTFFWTAFAYASSRPVLVMVFSDKYVAALPHVGLLLIAFGLDAIFFIMSAYWAGIGKAGRANEYIIVRSICVVPLAFVMSYFYGLSGGVLAFLIAVVIGVLWLFFRTKDYVDFDYSILYKAGFSALLMLFAVNLVTKGLGVGLFKLTVMFLVSFVVFHASLYGLRTFDDYDKKLVGSYVKKLLKKIKIK